jgi:hypothetical protein
MNCSSCLTSNQSHCSRQKLYWHPANPFLAAQALVEPAVAAGGQLAACSTQSTQKWLSDGRKMQLAAIFVDGTKGCT